MEKTIFLFRRKDGVSRDEFAQHYIQVHAPLGKRLTRCLLGYTVNLVQNRESPDSVTEHWVPDAMDILTPSKAYASMQDFEQVFTDDRSFIGDMDLYVAGKEEHVVAAEPLDAPLGQETGEAKAIWFYKGSGDVPPPPPGARRVIDNHISRKMVYRNDGHWDSLAPDISVIRMAWAPDFESFGVDLTDAVKVREYRFIPAPDW